MIREANIRHSQGPLGWPAVDCAWKVRAKSLAGANTRYDTPRSGRAYEHVHAISRPSSLRLSASRHKAIRRRNFTPVQSDIPTALLRRLQAVLVICFVGLVPCVPRCGTFAISCFGIPVMRAVQDRARYSHSVPRSRGLPAFENASLSAGFANGDCRRRGHFFHPSKIEAASEADEF